MTSGQGRMNAAGVSSLVVDLVETLNAQNADQLLVGQCLEQLLDVVETLGAEPTAMSVRERLGNADAAMRIMK